MKTIITLAIVAALFLFSGCMVVSMFGGNSHDDHSNSSSTTVQKEVITNYVKAEAVFPPLALNNATTFILKITDAETGTSLPDFDVWFHASYTHQMDASHQRMEHHGGMMNHSSDHSEMENHKDMMYDSSKYSQMDEKTQRDVPHGVNYDKQLIDSTRSGIFSVPFTPTQNGEYAIAFHIVKDGKKITEDIVVEQKLTAIEESHSSGGIMDSLGPYAIVVGAAMTALMIYSWVSGNSMF